MISRKKFLKAAAAAAGAGGVASLTATKLEPQEDAILLIQLGDGDRHLTREALEGWRDVLREMLGPDVPFLVTDMPVHVKAVRRSDMMVEEAEIHRLQLRPRQEGLKDERDQWWRNMLRGTST